MIALGLMPFLALGALPGGILPGAIFWTLNGVILLNGLT